MRHSLLFCSLLSIACGVGTDGGGGGGGGGSEDGSQAAPLECIKPSDMGNANGVGKYCTKGGGQCSFFSWARFCTVDFRDNVPGFCTNSCSADADCGEGAVCKQQPGGGPSGCTPVACLQKATPDAGQPPPETADAGTMSVECQALLTCCAAPGFPSKWESTCQGGVKIGATFCTLARKTYELEGDCPAQP
jgi:hypothetical protein